MLAISGRYDSSLMNGLHKIVILYFGLGLILWMSPSTISWSVNTNALFDWDLNSSPSGGWPSPPTYFSDSAGASHGWRDLIRQQESIDDNARRIEALQSSIARLQDSMELLAGSRAALGGNHDSGAGTCENHPISTFCLNHGSKWLSFEPSLSGYGMLPASGSAIMSYHLVVFRLKTLEVQL